MPPSDPHGSGPLAEPKPTAGVAVHVNGLDRWSEVGLSVGDVIRAARAALGSSPGVMAGELSISFVNDGEIASLNSRWLERAGPTDVIAFSLGTSVSVLGDIYISVDTAVENALRLEVAPAEELQRLVIHGTLHVLGHDHPDGPGRESSDMYMLQEELLRGLGSG